MTPGTLIFGGAVMLGGVAIILLRRVLGRFAHNYRTAVGSRWSRSAKYWTDYSIATGAMVCLVGTVIVLIGAFGGAA